MPYPHLTEDEMSRAHRDELYDWMRRFKKDLETSRQLYAEAQEELEGFRNPKASIDEKKHK